MTHCGRCGDCCERIHLGYGADKVFDSLARNWEQHGDDALDQKFILTHWNLIEVAETDGQEDPLFSCDFFDPATRQCGAYDQRPPVCQNFPWYDHGVDADPGETLPWGHRSTRCTFLADVIARMAVGG